jgi:hypothetical protein
MKTFTQNGYLYIYNILFRKVYKIGYLKKKKRKLNKKQTEIWTISPIHSSSYELQNSPSAVNI